MSFFQKLGSKIAGVAKKGISETSKIGSKVSGFAEKAGRALERAGEKVDNTSFLPSEVKGVIGGGLEVLGGSTRALGTGGRAISTLATGNVKGARELGKQALQEGKSSLGALQRVGREAREVAEVAKQGAMFV